MAKLSRGQIIALLKQKSQTTTCADLKKLLEDVGFVVKAGTKGKHHTHAQTAWRAADLNA